MSDKESGSNRRTPRQRALKGARMVCNGSQTFDVTIRDLSDGGVRLKLAAPFAVPAAFKLVIFNPNTGISETRSCALRWQRGDQLGAEFVVTGSSTDAGTLRPSLRRPPQD